MCSPYPLSGKTFNGGGSRFRRAGRLIGLRPRPYSWLVSVHLLIALRRNPRVSDLHFDPATNITVAPMRNPGAQSGHRRSSVLQLRFSGREAERLAGLRPKENRSIFRWTVQKNTKNNLEWLVQEVGSRSGFIMAHPPWVSYIYAHLWVVVFSCDQSGAFLPTPPPALQAHHFIRFLMSKWVRSMWLGGEGNRQYRLRCKRGRLQCLNLTRRDTVGKSFTIFVVVVVDCLYYHLYKDRRHLKMG